MKKETKYQKTVYLVIIFLIAFVPRMELVLHAIPLRTMGDELSTINGAALLAGYDWRATMTQCNYYGFGFYSLCAPFFHIFEDPILIYRAMLTVATLAQASTVLICFHICENYLGLEDNYLLISLISLACNYSVVTRSDIVYNEHPLILLFWLVALLLCKYLKEKKPCHLFLLYGLLIYSLTIHTRALMMLLAVTIYLLGTCLADRKMKRMGVVIALAGGTYIMATSFCRLYQNHVWESIDTVKNVEYTTNLSKVEWDVSTIQAWINIILGQLTSINFVLCGGAVLSVVAILFLLNDKTRKKNEILLAVFFLCFICIGGTIFAQSLSWLAGVSKAVRAEYYYAYSSKALTYVRYFGPYVGVAVMCGLVAFFQQKEKRTTILAVASAVDVLLLRFWMLYDMPYVSHNVYATEIFWPFGKIVSSEQVYSSSAYHAIVTAGGVGILLVLFLFIKKDRLFLLVLAVTLLYQYRYLGVYYDLQTQQENQSKIEQAYFAAKDFGKLDQIYVYDGSGAKTNNLSCLYQMYFYDTKVIPGLPDSSYEGYMFCNVPVDGQLEGYKYECIQFAEEQYVYIFGKE